MKTRLVLLLLFITGLLAAQTAEKPLSVGIFVYPGVEILDFTGPSEVFGSTDGFQPFIVALKKSPSLARDLSPLPHNIRLKIAHTRISWYSREGAPTA